MPITLNMHDADSSIFSIDDDVKLTNIIDYPKCSIGFQHYIHSLKKDTEILKQFENKKKVYLVTNEFEIEVDNYDNSISKETKKNLDIKDKTPNIISLNFYKIWELLFMFDLSDGDIPSTSLYLTDDGCALQSLMFYREKYAKNNKNDLYDIIKNQDINQDFINYYAKSKNIKVIDKVIDKISNKYDLIFSGISYDYIDPNTVEQEYFKTLFENLYSILKNQKKNGNCIIKMFETYTSVSAKFICMLNALYDKVFIVKPLTSKASSSERFIICIGFKYNDKDKEYTNIDKKIENIINIINKNQKLKIYDLFNKYEFTKQFKSRMIKLNTMLSNKYFKGIGEEVNFVNSQNYYGDKYQQYRDAQIEANNYWVETYLPNIKDFKEVKKKIMENSYNSNKINMDDVIKLEKELFD